MATKKQMIRARAELMTTSQPGDWIRKFKAKASLDGVSFSKWVGIACLRALDQPTEDEAPQKLLTRHNLTARPEPGMHERIRNDAD